MKLTIAISLLYGEQAKYFPLEVQDSLSHNRPGLLSTANNAADKNTSTVQQKLRNS
jgi:hypothetical protein